MYQALSLLGSFRTPSHRYSQILALLALLDLVLNRVIASLPDLGLEIEVNELVLLRFPLAISVAVVHQLAAAGVANFDSGVGKGAISRPLKLVAAILLDGEWLGATNVAVAVDALLYGVVEDLALGYRLSAVDEICAEELV
jgi:hypothetical protein